LRPPLQTEIQPLSRPDSIDPNNIDFIVPIALEVLMHFPKTFLGQLPIALSALLLSTYILTVFTAPRDVEQQTRLASLLDTSLAELSSE
jgi:hypothetical protein